MESRITGILNSISIKDLILQKVESDVLKSITASRSETETEKAVIARKIAEIKEKREGLEEKFNSNKLDQETFEKWNLKFNQEISLLDVDLNYISAKAHLTGEVVEKNINRLSKIGGIYQITSVEVKQELCR